MTNQRTDRIVRVLRVITVAGWILVLARWTYLGEIPARSGILFVISVALWRVVSVLRRYRDAQEAP